MAYFSFSDRSVPLNDRTKSMKAKNKVNGYTIYSGTVWRFHIAKLKICCKPMCLI